MKNNYFKLVSLLFVAYFYFFANGLLTRILYPYECKGIVPYIVFGAKTFNVIDMNIPHLIAFIVMGTIFNVWALLFSVIGEILQVIIKHNSFSLIDVSLNLIGSMIGILFTRLRWVNEQ